MRIGIDISQLAYPGTGVANYLGNLVEELVKRDDENKYILFFSSLRGKLPITKFQFANKKGNVVIKKFKFPPTLLNLVWNKLHILSIERFIGPVDFFVTSDWTEPPTLTAKKATILYDLVVFLYPNETAKNIIRVQKQKLKWVKKESDIVFCISESTKKDAEEILGIDKEKLRVLYPGI